MKRADLRCPVGSGRLLAKSFVSITLALAVALVAPAAEGSSDCPDDRVRYEPDKGSVSALVPLPGEVVSIASRAGADSGQDLVVLLRPRGPLSEAGQRLEAFLARMREAGVIDKDTATKLAVEGLDSPELARVIAAGLKREDRRACLEQSDLERPRLAVVHVDGGVAVSLLSTIVPADASALLTLDVDGDGRREILVQTAGSLAVMPPDAGAPEPLVEDPDLDLRVEEATKVRFPPDPVVIRSPFDDSDRVQHRRTAIGPMRLSRGWSGAPAHVRVTGLGEVRIYAPHPAAPEWDRAGAVALPVRATPDDTGLLLTGPQVRTVGTTAAGTLVLAAGPVPTGSDRLRNVVIQLEGRSVVAEDAWSRVEEGDVVQSSGYLLLDDLPHLWAITENELSVEFFGTGERFRLFRLTSDRTRLGGEPLLDVEVDKLPLRSGLKIGHDVDGDGRDDLLVIGRGQVTAVWSYVRAASGRFPRSPSRQTLAEGGRPLLFEDLDGDARADLLIADDASYRIHVGADGVGRKVVGDEARWTADRLGPAADAPTHLIDCRETWTEDLDRDGRHELLCLGHDAHGRDGLKIVRFEPPPVPGS